MTIGGHVLQAIGGSGIILLNPISAANTGAATSAWVDIRKFVGDLEIRVQTGALTGSLVWTLQDATDGSGTGAASIVPNEGAFATVTATQLQIRTLNQNRARGFLQLIGTIVTGPVLVCASLAGHPKNV